MNDFKKEFDALIKDVSASFWLRKAAADLENRDIVDALKDIERLQKLYQLKYDAMQPKIILDDVCIECSSINCICDMKQKADTQC